MKSLSLPRKKSRERKENPGYYLADSYRHSIDQESEKCSFPSPTSPSGDSYFVEGCKRSYEVDECENQPDYEEIDFPNGDRIPWYNTRGELFTSKQEPILKLDPQEPHDDYIDMDPTYNEPVPLMDLSKPVNDRKQNTKHVKPPMRKTISHSTVHSYKYPILAPEHQDMVPEPPKRVNSLGDSAEKKTIKKLSSGYDFVQNIRNSRTSFVKIVNEEVSTKIEPNNQGINHDDVIPSFPTKPQTEAKQNDYTKSLNQQILIKSQTLKPAPKPKIELHKSDSTPSVDDKPAPTKRPNKPPPPTVKPRPPKVNKTEVPKELNEQNTKGERNDRTIKDLGNHLKHMNVVESIHSKSQFKQLNLYQESPLKGVGLKQMNTFEK